MPRPESFTGFCDEVVMWSRHTNQRAHDVTVHLLPMGKAKGQGAKQGTAGSLHSAGSVV